MKREILINSDLPEKRVAILSDGNLEEFYIERPEDKTIVGNIYKGRIDTVVASLNAAFVDIGLEKKGFLYLSEVIEFGDYELANGIKSAPLKVKKGDEVLVQVVKEAFGTKGPRISCYIGLAGRYLVLAPQNNNVGISRRIDDEKERKRLKSVLQSLRLPKNVGFIVRTAAVGKSSKEILRDARLLLKLWLRIKKASSRRSTPSLVYEDYDLIFRVVRDSFTEDVNEVIVDSKPDYRRVHAFVRTFHKSLTRRIHFYQGVDLFFERNVDKQIHRLFERYVYMKSKAYIVIEPTEGLVVIDVNSGGFKKNLSPEEAAFRINSEAAVEIARQLRLRDLGGIIVVDFIDMEKEGHRREVLNILNHHLSKDKAKYDCLGISKFGVVQLTRERVHNTVQAQSSQICPYCQGRSKIKSATTLCISSLRQLRRHLHSHKQREVSLTLNPAVVVCMENYRDALRMIGHKYRSKIHIISNPTQHLEEIKIK